MINIRTVKALPIIRSFLIVSARVPYSVGKNMNEELQSIPSICCSTNPRISPLSIAAVRLKAAKLKVLRNLWQNNIGEHS